MVMTKCYWTGSGVLFGGGAILFLMNMHHDGSPWRLLGLTFILLGGSTLNSGYIAMRARSMDEEFASGYRVGFRAGRRAGKPVVVGIDSGRNRGRVQEAPLWAVAGDREDARRSQADAH